MQRDEWPSYWRALACAFVLVVAEAAMLIFVTTHGHERLAAAIIVAPPLPEKRPQVDHHANASGSVRRVYVPTHAAVVELPEPFDGNFLGHYLTQR